MKNRVQTLSFALKSFIALATATGVTVDKYTAKDTTMYLTYNAAGKGGTQQLVDANTKKIEGITNFDGNKLDKGRYIVIDGIRTLFDGVAATPGAANWESDVIPALKNAEFSIIQNEEIFGITLNDVFNLHFTESNSNDGDFRDISHFPIIQPDTVFKLQITFPDGVNIPADAKALLRVELRCHEVLVKQ